MDSSNIKALDWERVFAPVFFPDGYLWEILLRTVIMFLFLIIMLKFLSKRGVKQLSVFELAILIALGSATGDPMFYHNVPVTHGIVVLVVVIVLYRVITFFTGKSVVMEKLLEGKPKCLLDEGLIEIERFRKVGLPYDKFFSELRLHSVDHLGQLRKVYLETSGELSVYFYPDEHVRPGLVIFPEVLERATDKITIPDTYSCTHCGNVEQLGPGEHHCKRCDESSWAPPSITRRIA